VRLARVILRLTFHSSERECYENDTTLDILIGTRVDAVAFVADDVELQFDAAVCWQGDVDK
jgi:hypothetical protein